MTDNIDFQPDVGFQADQGAQQSPEDKSLLGKIANSPQVNFTLGFGDSVRNSLTGLASLLPGVNINPIQSSEGKAYNLGDWEGKVLPLATGIGESIEAPAAINYAKSVAEPISSASKNALNYVRPGKSANELMTNLGGGPEGATTAQENSANIAKRVQLAYNSNKADALASKQNVLDQVGKKDMFEIPESQLPEGNLNEVAELFNKGEPIKTSQADELRNSLKEYRKNENPNLADISEKEIEKYGSAQKAIEARKNENFNNFIDSAHDIFPSGEDISEEGITHLENMLALPTKSPSNYINAAKNYDYTNNALKDLHDAFIKNPTFKNADELQSQLGNEIGRLSYKADKKDLDTNGYNELQALKKLRDGVNADQKTFLQNTDSKLDQEYDAFRQKWRDNVVPYNSHDTLIKMGKGQTTGHSINDIAGIFRNDAPNADKIAQDIGPSGKNAILYNELQKVQPGDAKGLVNALNESRRIGGYQSYVTPELQAQGQQIKNQLLARNALNIGGSTAAGLIGGGIFGHPLMGATAGAFAKPFLSRLLNKLDEIPK